MRRNQVEINLKSNRRKVVIRVILVLAFILTSCSTVDKLGFWASSYTQSVSFWQCVEPFTPYKNKDC